MGAILNLGYLLFLLLLSPYFLYQRLAHGKYRMHMSRRLGWFAPRPDTGRPCLLIHGVSVGEALAIKPLLAALREALPGWDFAISVTTDTGWRVAEQHFPDLPRFRFPLDFTFAVRAFFAGVRPRAVVLMESELWPNFIRYAWALSIPVVQVNGRLSERSFARFRRMAWFWRPLLRKLRFFLVQSETYRQRLLDLGMAPDTVEIVGTVKYDAIPTEPDPAGRARYRRLFGWTEAHTVIVGGSTHDGEEAALLAAYRELTGKYPNLRLMLVPRHPPRAEAVSSAILAAGFTPVRRSVLKDDAPADGLPGTLIQVDTVGELSTLYEAGDIVFVGGSLIPHGGQNMLEPAGLGKAVLFGPHTFNFDEPVQVLLENRAAIRVRDASELLRQLEFLVANENERNTMARSAREAVAARKGASAASASRLRDLLQSSVR